MEKKNNAGAVASNAGDDFHLIWACKKILKILEPNSQLTAVSVEGPSWSDSIQDIDETKLYSIDLAEYYGGKDFSNADSVIFSQLKYSAFRMDKSWTISELCTNTNKEKNKNNSIIRRLADTYSKYCETYISVDQRLVLKLVSNRSLTIGLAKHLADCKALLKKKKYKRTADLLKTLDKECGADIRKLYETSNLSSRLFIGFLQVLSFEDCGVNIRSIHQAEIIQQLGVWNVNNISNKYNDLIMHLRDMMLPQQVKGFPMDREYVLSALQTTDNELFPASAKFEKPLHGYIKRDIDEVIIQNIKDKKTSVICLQATAGAGKTTFVNNLKDYLPKESVSVIYDCYGGGAFLQPEERRHLADVAIPQICNTLATKCGTNWLIGRPNKEYEWWRFLKDRLEKAAQYVRTQNPKAVVTIVIDAADNSMIAAKSFKEEAFLHGLLNQTFPDNVYLIVTTRTERRHLIPFGDGVEDIPLPEFTLPESTLHIRAVFPKVTDEECEEFHLLTHKNPRMQAYMLSSAGTIEEIIGKIKPIGKTMDMLFKEFIDASKTQYSSMVDIAVLFSSLIKLPRPIPDTVLCGICQISMDMLKSISSDCHFGFYISDNKVYFRDEDFETYLRNRYEDVANAVCCIANYMYNNRHEDSYCMRYLHIFLDEAGRFSELVEISLNENVEVANIGVVQTNHIMQERIRYALKQPEMLHTENRIYACKLIYKLIDFNANDDILNEMLYKVPYECVSYCDELSIYNLFHTDSNNFDRLSKAALVFSQMPAYKEDAKQYIRSYIASINVYYNKLEENRDYRFRPRTTDIVNIAEAFLRLGENDKAIQWVNGWTPKKVTTKYVYQLIKNLLESENSNIISESLLLYSWSSPNKLAIVSSYLSVGLEPPQIYVQSLLKLFKRVEIIPEERFDIGQLIIFMEYILRDQDKKEIVPELVSKYPMEVSFSIVPSIYTQNERNKLSTKIRYYFLKHLKDELPKDYSVFWKDRVPAETEIVTQKQKSNNKKSVMQIMEYLFPIFRFRIQCIQSDEKDELLVMCKNVLSRIERSLWNMYSYDRHKLLEMGILIFTESICLSSVFDQREIKEQVINALNVTNTSPEFKLELLNRLIYNKQASQAVLFVLSKIDSAYEKYPASAKEMTEVYLSCARIGHTIDKELGKIYFRKAIECTNGPDYEAYRKIYLYRELVDKLNKAGGNNSEMSFKIVRLSEDFCKKISDTKNFPFEESLSAAALLDKQGIWGAICRLDDRDNYDGFSLQETIPIVLKTLIERDLISEEDMVALLCLLLPDYSYQYNGLVDILLQKICSLVPKRQKPMLEILSHDILYNIPMDEKKDRSRHMVSYLDSVVLSPDLDTKKIRNMNDFLEQFDYQNTDYEKINANRDNKSNVKQNTLKNDITSLDILVQRLKELKEDEKITFIKQWLENLMPENYVEALTWLMEAFSSERFYLGVERILDEVASFIDSIDLWPQVKEWRNNKKNQKYFLHAFMGEFLYLHHIDEALFQTILRIFPADENTLYEVFLEYVSNNVQSFDEQLVKAICRMSVALSVKDVDELLKWCLDIEMLRVHPFSGDNENLILNLIENDNMDDCIAKFIWRLLGHPDKGLRCKASHVLLRLSLLGDMKKIEQISKLYEMPLSLSYMDRDNYFFVDSARLWFLSTCLRIVKVSSQSLVQLYDFFTTIACAEGDIHALHRRAARNICLELSSGYNETDRDQFLVCDQCIKGDVKKLSIYERENSAGKKKRIFNFNTTDTLRYWYDDLAMLFSCSQEEVASECDYFIAQFGITNDCVEEWSQKYLLNNDYMKTSNSQGSIPTIETLEKYAEWHAMFYVADKFRKEKIPVEDWYLTYEQWLENYLPGKEGFWCFEFRNHIPLIPFFWEFKKITKNESEQEYYIPEDLIDSLLDNDLGITLYMDYHAKMKQSFQYISIESAFIDESNMDEFFTEIQKPYKQFWDFYEKKDWYGKSSSCSIFPTCEVAINFPDYALDKKDLLLKDYLLFSNDLMGLSDDFAKYLSITKQEQIITSRVYDSKTTVVHTYHWSEPENESGYEKNSTYGQLVYIEKDCLRSVLNDRNQAIVFMISVSFHDDEYQFYGEPSKPVKKKYLYSYDKNGNSKMVFSKDD